MKIYTKTGDKGTTALVGGTRVSKDNIRVNAYGTVDELISMLGFLRAQSITPEQNHDLCYIQQCLMTASSHLASDGSGKKLPEIKEEDIQMLENGIDRMLSTCPVLHAFVLPAPPASSALCHIARSVCRRAEREAVAVQSQFYVPDNVMKYLNRLSDYLFALSRQLTADSGVKDEVWLS
jgi:cob(I)alamin adenosyltransferase